jgi:hypothetical protein
MRFHSSKQIRSTDPAHVQAKRCSTDAPRGVTGKCFVVAGSEGNQSGPHLSKAFAGDDIVRLNGQIIACRQVLATP